MGAAAAVSFDKHTQRLALIVSTCTNVVQQHDRVMAVMLLMMMMMMMAAMAAMMNE